MRMFKDFFETGNFLKNLNTTFIVMVPKKEGGGGGGGGVHVRRWRAKEFKDYKPGGKPIQAYSKGPSK